jgi:hypothetical protein
MRVSCTEPALHQAIETWLADSRLHPPRSLEMSVTVTDKGWRGSDSRQCLRQPDMTLYYGSADESLRLVWKDGAGHAIVNTSSGGAEVTITQQAADQPGQWFRPFLLLVVAAQLRSVGWSHIHAATAVDPAGRGWLVAGDSHSGKSTTAALLASRGWAVGTDDTAFLVDSSTPVEVAGWHEPIALRDGGYHLLGLSGGQFLARRQKTGFLPEELGGRWVDRVVPDIVAIADIHDGPTRLEPVRRALVVADLLSWSLLFVVDPGGAQRHLELVTRLAAQCRCYRLRLGRDIFEHPDLLSALAS